MNNKYLSRRRLLTLISGVAASSLVPWNIANANAANVKAKIVIIGGGAAGTVAAKYLHRLNPLLDISIIEKNAIYQSAIMSNQLIGGDISPDNLNFNYAAFDGSGIRIINDEVVGLDDSSKHVITKNKGKFGYDKLIVATGSQADLSSIIGLTDNLVKDFAWTSAQDVLILADKIKTLKPGGKILVSIPSGDVNGLTSAYERVSQFANYLSINNKKAKIIVVDAQQASGLSRLVTSVWDKKYPGMIEYHQKKSVTEIVNPSSVVVSGEKITADFINLIPPQVANILTRKLGLTDESGWCPVNFSSFESTLMKDVHIIGDSMKGFSGCRKNAQMANSQAKIIAIMINNLLSLNKLPASLPPLIDSEYGMVAKKFAISSTKIFRFNDSKWNVVTDEISSIDAPDKQRYREYLYAESWFNNLTNEMFS